MFKTYGSGSNASKNGNKYEKQIWNILKNTTLNELDFNTQNIDDLAGSSSKSDIECNYNNIKLGIECKNTIKAEFIQIDIKRENNKWVGPKLTKKSHPEIVINRYLDEVNKRNDLYYGNPPNFPFDSRKDFENWEQDFLKKKEKMGGGNKKDYIWYIDDTNFVKNNYKDKNNYYIQIKDYGLYHLGNDICSFGVPEFIPGKIKLRLRCKRLGKKGCIPSSLTLSAWIEDLEKSQYSLDNKDLLPPQLIFKE